MNTNYKIQINLKILHINKKIYRLKLAGDEFCNTSLAIFPKLDIIQYAGDMAALAELAGELQEALNEFYNYCKTWHECHFPLNNTVNKYILNKSFYL